MNIFSVNINYFHKFFGFFKFPCYRETNDVSIQQMMLAFSHSQPTLNRLFNNCIKLLDYLFLKYEEGVEVITPASVLPNIWRLG